MCDTTDPVYDGYVNTSRPGRRSLTMRPRASRSVEDINYYGIVDLLDLRGGGGLRGRPHSSWDDGRGVAAWLDAEESDDERRSERLALCCDVCGAHPPTADWAWCECRQRQCGACIARPCDLCASRRADPPIDPSAVEATIPAGRLLELVGECQPVTISLADHLGLDEEDHLRWMEENIACGSRPGSGGAPERNPDPPRLASRTGPWTITGFRDGVKVRICGQCAHDRPLEGGAWSTCACGAVFCEQCARSGCRSCGHGAPGSRDDAQHDEMRGPQDGPEHDHDGTRTQPPCPERDWSNWPVDEHVQAPWVILDADGPDPTVDHSNLSLCGRCLRCKRWLGEWGIEWRSCACGARVCTDCSGYRCPTCGSPSVFGQAQAESEGTGLPADPVAACVTAGAHVPLAWRTRGPSPAGASARLP